MLAIFDEEFAKINAAFDITFREIFGGGSAKLVLVDSEDGDPHKAGVDIIASPPGTNLTNINLLSGGQKTLTVSAIIFAILRVKQTPFCVFDEIEAALDDTNSAIIARYMKKYSQETQLISITHTKPTMEMADRLYGITMEEKGVSKVISVKLAEAVKHAE